MASSPKVTGGADQLYLALISAIESAETEVCITNAYFVPHPQLVAALAAAARRGVDVQLVLPAHTDSALVYHAGRAHYEPLLEAGVKIYERKERLLHAKSAVIDGVWSAVGSTNLDWRSLAYNDELNAVVLGPDFAMRMKAIFGARPRAIRGDHAREVAGAADHGTHQGGGGDEHRGVAVAGSPRRLCDWA
jgi:cardiolipin synthase